MTATSKSARTAATSKPQPAWASHVLKASVEARKARAVRPAKPAPAAPAIKPSRPDVPPVDRRLLTIKNTEIALDCSRSTVLRLIKSEKLRVVTLGARAVRVVAADVDALLG